MGVRTGAEFMAGLRDSREVWLGAERVKEFLAPPGPVRPLNFDKQNR